MSRNVFNGRLAANFRRANGSSPMRTYATYNRFSNAPRSVLSLEFLLSPTIRRFVISASIMGFGIYYINLDKAPITGRRRFMIIPPSLERKIGEYSYKQMFAQFNGKYLPENHPMTQQVKTIMAKLIKAATEDEHHLPINQDLLKNDWKIHIVNDPKQPPNAFVMPGGKVFVFSSILPVCENEDGLATVLSHELSHQLARHTSENLSKAPFYMALGLIMYTITGSDVFNSMLLNILIKSPASREMETEADYIGLMTMAKACYNPGEAVHLWERMKNMQAKNGHVPEFLSTHPDDSRRISNMQSWLHKAEQIRDNSGCGPTRDHYRAFSNNLNLKGLTDQSHTGFFGF